MPPDGEDGGGRRSRLVERGEGEDALEHVVGEAVQAVGGVAKIGTRILQVIWVLQLDFGLIRIFFELWLKLGFE